MAKATSAQSGPLLDPSFGEPESMARVLDAHPDYRVLRRLQPTLDFGRQASGEVAHIVLLDTETTGLDATKERIIELALLRVTLCVATGLPLRVTAVYDELEDPGKPIPPQASEVTGITTDMVRGRRLNEGAIAELMQGVELVIAHNARFDRAFVEQRLPAFAQLPWACSLVDLDWSAQGRGSAKLEFLAQSLGWFYDAHRAEMDCHALLAVLSAPLPIHGQTGLAHLWHAAQRPTYRVYATGSPFESKDALRTRGYRWDAERKVWHTAVPDTPALEAELSWLASAVYSGRKATIELAEQTALDRHSTRPGALRSVTLPATWPLPEA